MKKIESIHNKTKELTDDELPFNPTNILLKEEDLKEFFDNNGLIGVKYNNLNLYRNAFIHKSYCSMKNTDFASSNSKCPPNCIPLQDVSYERLEFLGDAILNLIVANYLYMRFPEQNEGFLSKIRTRIVNGKMLGSLAEKIGFNKFAIISKQVEDANGRNNYKIMEDIFEAFIGAMMTDLGSKSETEGFSICNTFIINLIESKIDITELILNDDNYKDQLMRYYQKEFNGKFPKYEQKTIIMSTNDNGIVNRKFHMFVRDTNNNIIGEGIAKSKKEAEQKAAKAALMYFGISNGF
jgi:ribonuclease-3